MFDALARLADRRARRVGLVAILFFVLAAALGGSVAKRLDPYGADDPATESVKASETLQNAGFRAPGAIVIVKNAPVASPATRARVESMRARAAPPQGRRLGDRVLATRSGPSSPTTAAPPTSPSATPTEDKQWQAADAHVADQLAARPAVAVGGPAVSQEQVNKQVGDRPAEGRDAGLPPPLPVLRSSSSAA